MKGEDIMREIIKKGAILFIIYSIFTVYLFLASERIERLEEQDDEYEKVNVTIIYGE